MKKQIKIQYITRKDTTTPDFGRAFLDVLVNRHRQLAPDVYDTKPGRECTNRFFGIEEALPKWAWRGIINEVFGNIPVRKIPFVGANYIKRSKKTNYYLSINHTDFDEFGNKILGVFSFYIRIDNNKDWFCIFRDLSQVIEPVLARMHIYLGAEAVGFSFDSPQMLFMAGPSEPEMRDGLTNLGWANVFSEEYASEVDEERLRAHGFTVEAVPGGKLFTVTNNLFDVVDDFANFSRRRAELKSLFRPGLFQITDEPELPTT